MCSVSPYKQVHIDLVGQFWHPQRISQRKLERAVKHGLKHFSEKPRLTIFNNPEYGAAVALWLPR